MAARRTTPLLASLFLLLFAAHAAAVVSHASVPEHEKRNSLDGSSSVPVEPGFWVQ